MKNVIRSFAVISLLTVSQAAIAQKGAEGKDYAKKTVNLKSGRPVKVTASTYSVTEGRDNAAKVILTINGKVVDDKTQRAERATAQYTLEEKGIYKILATCESEQGKRPVL